MIRDARLNEIIYLAADGVAVDPGYMFDARPWGREYISVEMVPRESGKSKFHVRVP